MQYFETALFFVQRGLILGNQVDAAGYVPKAKNIQQFGLFDSSAPNYVSFDPSISPDDFNPKPEDFIYPEFRLLSETTVRERHHPIDFSKDGVLKASMGLLNGTPIFPDHEPSIGNSLGIIDTLYWQEAYEVDGVKVPAGINARLKLDGKANPRIARLLLMKPSPGINSTSVTVAFNWEKSHNMSDENFSRSFGKMGPDGKLVRKVVNQIMGYPEVSLVSMGADRFAQMVNEKQIVNPNKAQTALSYFYYDYSKLVSKEPQFDYLESFSLINNKQTMDRLALLTTALQKFGVNLQDVNWDEMTAESLGTLLEPLAPVTIPDNIQALMVAHPDITTDMVAQLTANQITQDQTQQLAEIETLRQQAQFANEQLNSFREEVIANYRLTVGPDQESPVIVQMLQNSPKDVLKELNAGYVVTLNALQPITCQECGSTHLERRLSKKPVEVSNTQSLEEGIRKSKSMKPSAIHGKAKA